MKKKNWKLGGLALLTALTSFGALTSCSFFSGDEAITIKECTYETNDDGSVTVTIVYENEDKKPLVFTIPAAVGVKEVKGAYDEDENLIVTIITTDGVEHKFKVDAVRSIDHIETTFDEETGDTLVTVYYTDGTFEETPIRIQKGDKGDPGNDGQDGQDGRGIADIKTNVELDGSTTVRIIMDDEDATEYTFSVPPGVGIVDIQFETVGNKHQLTVVLSNGDVITQEFDRLPGWFSGPGDPTNLNPIEGDFYYDTESQIIYRFTDGAWRVVVDFGGQSTTDRRRINFDLNAYTDDGEDDLTAYFPGSSSSKRVRTEYCPKGHTFYDTRTDIPAPVRAGYDFVGWYPQRNYNPVTGGQFTLLTTVWSDMTLYAGWQESTVAPADCTVTFALNAYNGLEVDTTAHFPGVSTDIRHLKAVVPVGRTLTDIAYALPAPERDGFTFEGWFLDRDSQANPVTATTVINASVTAFASWSVA